MKQIGIVKEFDNYNGLISGIDNKEYKLMKHEIKGNVTKGDIVIFDSETVNNETTNIARFVKKLNKEKK